MERDAHHLRELLGDLGLADARRPGQEKRADGLLGGPQPGARELDRRDELRDGRVLSEDDRVQVGLEALEPRSVARRDLARRDLRHARQDVLDVAA